MKQLLAVIAIGIMLGVFIPGGLAFSQVQHNQHEPIVVVLKSGDTKMVCEVDKIVINKDLKTLDGKQKVKINCTKLINLVP